MGLLESHDRSATPCERSTIQLKWVDNANVTITPENEDRYTVRVKRAIQLLDLGRKADLFNSQLRWLFKRIATWLKDRDDVAKAYLDLRDGVFSFVVVRNTVEYSADFEDQLSEFDIAVANDPDLNLVKMNAISLPFVSEETICQFVNPSTCIEFSWQQGYS